MGFRTVVMLNNDQAHTWSNDTELGMRIAAAMNHASSPSRAELANLRGYGRVVECTHADTQTLAMIDGYTEFSRIACDAWAPGESPEQTTLRLLKTAARKMGYRLVKDAKAAA